MKIHTLFSVFGVECEYMIVDENTLAAKPISDILFQKKNGEYQNEIENGRIAWNNELALHIIELKTNGPVKNLVQLDKVFHENITIINNKLKFQHAKLLATGTHPFFYPEKETVLWPHGNKTIYQTYDKIFGCRAHGWSNLQSMHLNLPFSNDREFVQLYTAIRCLLPIIPSLTASTPLLEGKITGYVDTRLKYYGTNQKKIPFIAGSVIPEPIGSIAEYHNKILKKIYQAIAPYDLQGTLQKEWLNSRGAIARFERNAIEIRLIDIQECPLADLACANLFIVILQHLVSGRYSDPYIQYTIQQNVLCNIYRKIIQYGFAAKIDSLSYLKLFGFKKRVSVQTFWEKLFECVKDEIKDTRYQKALEHIITHGNLAERILKTLGATLDKQHIIALYQKLADCLASNSLL